jgi:hypothetical protein
MTFRTGAGFGEAEQAKSVQRAAVAYRVLNPINDALDNRKCVIIRGNSGVGKSEALKAWADMHRGHVRFVTLKGINHRTAFFRSIAKALGVGSTFTLSASKVQARVEDFLEHTGIMLLIDEGQYLFSGQKRIEREPELVNWLMTACHNFGVPFAIVATREFDRRRQATEQQTTWSSHQLTRRVKRSIELPEVPTKQDMEAVAKKLLPQASSPILKMIIGYAMTSGRFMDGIVEVIEDAQVLARQIGHDSVAFNDVQRTIEEIRGPSDASLKRALIDPAPKLQRSRRAAADPIFTADNSGQNAIRDRGGLRESGPAFRSNTPALAVG